MMSSMKKHNQINWPQLLADLTISSELTVADIARRIDCKEGRLRGLKAGATREPVHSVGEKLKELYREIVGLRFPLLKDTAKCKNKTILQK
jgi:hypothetical protein